LLIVSPDSLGTACPLSGRNSTYRPVQISAAGSCHQHVDADGDPDLRPHSVLGSAVEAFDAQVQPKRA
jgi:hypothetical protein